MLKWKKCPLSVTNGHYREAHTLTEIRVNTQGRSLYYSQSIEFFLFKRLMPHNTIHTGTNEEKLVFSQSSGEVSI